MLLSDRQGGKYITKHFEKHLLALVYIRKEDKIWIEIVKIHRTSVLLTESETSIIQITQIHRQKSDSDILPAFSSIWLYQAAKVCSHSLQLVVEEVLLHLHLPSLTSQRGYLLIDGHGHDTWDSSPLNSFNSINTVKPEQTGKKMSIKYDLKLVWGLYNQKNRAAWKYKTSYQWVTQHLGCQSLSDSPPLIWWECIKKCCSISR